MKKLLAIVALFALAACDTPQVRVETPAEKLVNARFVLEAKEAFTGGNVYAFCDTKTGNLIYAMEWHDFSVAVAPGGCAKQ